MLADKVSGNLLGLWLLVPEHLRLGSWDLLQGWSPPGVDDLPSARLALHIVHEAALCRPTLRADRSLRHRGFEVANGLPWLPTDGAVHDWLNAHTVEQSHQFQVRLGQLRRASGDFPGPVLAPGIGLDSRSRSNPVCLAARPWTNRAGVTSSAPENALANTTSKASPARRAFRLRLRKRSRRSSPNLHCNSL